MVAGRLTLARCMPWSVWTRSGSRWSKGRLLHSTNASCYLLSARGWVLQSVCHGSHLKAKQSCSSKQRHSNCYDKSVSYQLLNILKHFIYCVNCITTVIISLVITNRVQINQVFLIKTFKKLDLNNWIWKPVDQLILSWQICNRPTNYQSFVKESFLAKLYFCWNSVGKSYLSNNSWYNTNGLVLTKT